MYGLIVQKNKLIMNFQDPLRMKKEMNKVIQVPIYARMAKTLRVLRTSYELAKTIGLPSAYSFQMSIVLRLKDSKLLLITEFKVWLNSYSTKPKFLMLSIFTFSFFYYYILFHCINRLLIYLKLNLNSNF